MAAIEKSDRDYPEGAYWHGSCRVCGLGFMGPKRDLTCRLCAKDNTPITPEQREVIRAAEELVKADRDRGCLRFHPGDTSSDIPRAHVPRDEMEKLCQAVRALRVSHHPKAVRPEEVEPGTPATRPPSRVSRQRNAPAPPTRRR